MLYFLYIFKKILKKVNYYIYPILIFLYYTKMGYKANIV